MTQATLFLAKKLTVVTNNYAYMRNLSEVPTEAVKYDEVTLKGAVRKEKFSRYFEQILSVGYVVVCENWRREDCPAKGAVDVSITLKRA